MSTPELLLTCRRNGRRLGAAVLLVLPLALPAQTAGVAGTMPEDFAPGLRDVLTTALKQSPQMLQQNIALAQSEANRYLNDSALWPSVVASGGYGFSGSRTTSEPVSSSSSVGLNYGISMGQALYQWGALKAQSDIARISQQVAERQLADAYRGLTTTLRSQYLGLIAKKVTLRNARYQIKLQEASLATQEQQLKDGTLSEGEIISPRLSFQEAILNFERQEQDYAYNKRLFLRTAGLEQLAEESIPEGFARPPYAAALADSLLGGFLGQGVQNTFQAQIYILNLKQNDLTYHIAKVSQFYPKFSFGANYGLSNSSTIVGNASYSSSGIAYGASISGYVPLFNGFSTRGQKLQALASKRSTELQLRNYLNSAADTAQNLRRQVDFLARALDLAEARRALAQDAVRKVTEQVKEGSLSQTTLDNTTGAFNYADYVAVSARAEYLNRWSEFVSLVGADPVLTALPARYLNLSHAK